VSKRFRRIVARRVAHTARPRLGALSRGPPYQRILDAGSPSNEAKDTTRDEIQTVHGYRNRCAGDACH